MKNLVADLTGRLGEKVRVEGTTLQATVRQGDAWFATRIRTEPVAELYVTTRALDGFELSVRWGDRWRDPEVGEDTFDGAFGLATNDEPLMRSWLDEPARRALLDSIYTFQVDDLSYSESLGLRPGDRGWQPAATGQRTWTYELRDDELAVTKGSSERNAERFMRAIVTACTVAARSQRWAAEYAVLARSLGGSAASELELGGKPIIMAARDGVGVSIRVLRRVAGGVGRLRTLVSAPRAQGSGTLSLVDQDFPRTARPALPDGSRHPLELASYQLRASSPEMAAKLDETTRKLVMLARPGALTLDASAVELWLDGAPMEHARLDAAVVLVTRCAIDAIAVQGPYR
jgi:hypothetical protein